jgi:hypothetical protein
MPDCPDHLDVLFAELRAEPRRPASIDVTLEERIMKEFSNVRGAGRRRGKLAASIAAAVLVVCVAGGVGVAGGFEALKGWLTGKVELVAPDGSSATLNVQDDEVLDDQGNVIGRLTFPDGDGEQSEKGPVTVEPSKRDR